MRSVAVGAVALIVIVACSATPGPAAVADAGWGEGGPQCSGSYVVDMHPDPSTKVPACAVEATGVRIRLVTATGAATVAGAPTITLPGDAGGSFGAGLTFGETDCSASEFPCIDGASVGCGYMQGYNYAFALNVAPNYRVTGTAGVGCVATPAAYNCACVWSLTGTFSPN
jgi:hypothetical protein